MVTNAPTLTSTGVLFPTTHLCVSLLAFISVGSVSVSVGRLSPTSLFVRCASLVPVISKSRLPRTEDAEILDKIRTQKAKAEAKPSARPARRRGQPPQGVPTCGVKYEREASLFRCRDLCLPSRASASTSADAVAHRDLSCRVHGIAAVES